jgi:hypothetical protein
LKLTNQAILLTTLWLTGCTFLPESQPNPQQKCNLFFPELKLKLNTQAYQPMTSPCVGEGDAVLVCLALMGVVIPAGSLVVSGSIVLSSNTLRWLEYQGHCDDGVIQKALQKIKTPN